MEGKIVFQGESKKGNSVLIRYPTGRDLNVMWKYINALSKERTFVLLQGEEVTVAEEKKFLKNKLKKIKNKEAVLLLAFAQDKLVGICGIDMKDKIERHVGSFAVSIGKNVRGKGMGHLLMKLALEEGKKALPQLRIISLGVFANNKVAVSLYKKFGFEEYGRLPAGIRYKDSFVDHIYMYKNI